MKLQWIPSESQVNPLWIPGESPVNHQSIPSQSPVNLQSIPSQSPINPQSIPSDSPVIPQSIPSDSQVNPLWIPSQSPVNPQWFPWSHPLHGHDEKIQSSWQKYTFLAMKKKWAINFFLDLIFFHRKVYFCHPNCILSSWAWRGCGYGNIFQKRLGCR